MEYQIVHAGHNSLQSLKLQLFWWAPFKVER